MAPGQGGGAGEERGPWGHGSAHERRSSSLPIAAPELEVTAHAMLPTALQGSICDLILEAALAVHVLMRDLDDELGALPAQQRLLVRISPDGSSTVNALARFLGVTPAAVSRMVQRLEDYGYVRPRVRSRRGTPVVLTALGESVRKLALPAEELDAALTVGMGEEEVRRLKQLLERLIRANRGRPHRMTRPAARRRLPPRSPPTGSRSGTDH